MLKNKYLKLEVFKTTSDPTMSSSTYYDEHELWYHVKKWDLDFTQVHKGKSLLSSYMQLLEILSK